MISRGAIARGCGSANKHFFCSAFYTVAWNTIDLASNALRRVSVAIKPPRVDLLCNKIKDVADARNVHVETFIDKSAYRKAARERKRERERSNKSFGFSLRRISREEVEGARLIPKHALDSMAAEAKKREIDKSRAARDGKQKLRIRKEALVEAH